LKVDFKKVGREPKSVYLERDGVALRGELRRGNRDLTEFKGKLSNNILVRCIRCGEEFLLPLDEELNLRFSDGVYRGSEELDIIEFYDGKIDFQEVLESEMESIRLDYHLCPQCKGEEYGSTKATGEQDKSGQKENALQDQIGASGKG